MKLHDGLILPMKLSDISIAPGSCTDLSWYMKTWRCVVDVNSKSIQVEEEDLEFGGNDDGVGDFGLNDSTKSAKPTKKKSMTPYIRHVPKFQTLMNQVKTPEQHEYVEQMFKKALVDVISLGRKKSKVGRLKDDREYEQQSTGHDTLHSLNEVETSAQKRRAAPIGSPSRHNRRKSK